jgi:hypothetical protein
VYLVEALLQAGRSRVRFALTSLDVFNCPNPSSCTMAMGSIQSLTEMSTRNLPGVKGWPARKADNPMGLQGLLQE